ncbi:FUSC family protein [Xanthobacter oligotrophicus]|uniref:FUSC family protein n=1 Tax=Xanthobacter oligotrophicus TaxID=2607286 RepID=UPI0011F35306|nr:FUSC family protein [Xanthobacter oligotrophicus]MCG5236900.1 FUSC family protein [Xanthobacter oligotrophicus]
MIARPALERLGFDPIRLNFTLRTALAACCALLVAWLVGLEHPQWSAMTVWAAAQPVRGQLVEKSFFRAVGTIIGSVAGIGLLFAAHGQQWAIVLGLAVWIGLCAGAGNLLRGFASYGAMLAGYSAAMVTLLHSTLSAGPFVVGIDRMLTVLLGVGVALAIGWVFAAPADPDDPARRVRRLTSRILNDLAAHLAGTLAPGRGEHQNLLSEMAAIEDALDGHAAGSLRSRATIRAIRRLLTADVALLLWMRRPPRPACDAALVAAVQQAAEASSTNRPQDAEATLRHAAELAGSDRMLHDALEGLAEATQPNGAGGARTGAHDGVVLHRDFIGAREALIRATVTLLAVGAAWLATGWEAGAFMLLGAAIMTSIFSTADNPAQTLKQVMMGQMLGAAGALACRWLVWPHADSAFGLVLAMMPFILLGAFIQAHRRTAGPVGFDYSMVVLLMLQPAWPLAGTFAHSLMLAGAVVLGPAVGLLAFLLIFPVDGRRRLSTLVTMMVHDLQSMAGRRGASRHRAVWRGRLYHRVLRLARWADKTGGSREQAVEGGFAVLLLGSAILHMDEALHVEVFGRPDLAPGTARRLNAALARLRHVGTDPERAARALGAAAKRLAADGAGDGDLLREAATELSQRAAFIRLPGRTVSTSR